MDSDWYDDESSCDDNLKKRKRRGEDTNALVDDWVPSETVEVGQAEPYLFSGLLVPPVAGAGLATAPALAFTLADIGAGGVDCGFITQPETAVKSRKKRRVDAPNVAEPEHHMPSTLLK